jgi:hypothetical protein
MGTVKEEARRLVDSMPEHATWDDLMYEFYVKKRLEQALKEAEVGEVIPHNLVKLTLSPN